MKRTLITPNVNDFPVEFRSLLLNAKIFDSSCSEAARVYFIDRDKGYYLKKAAVGSLGNEAAMTEYLHKKGLAANVLGYISDGNDWLLTEKVQGEDCTHGEYLSDPKRLCDTLATLLRELHETDFSGCPIADRTARYVETAINNYHSGTYDASHFPDSFGYSSAAEAYKIIEENKHLLKCDTLIHGDYCLPNIMLNNWNFSGYIDVDCGGTADRHIDIFWGIWSLAFNLRTDAYLERFLDAYGRDSFDPEMLRVIAAFEVFG